MKNEYEIPLEGAKNLKIGQWVEIFEAYDSPLDNGLIQVKTMRVGGETLVFKVRSHGQNPKRALRPHEGEVTSVATSSKGARFNIRFRS